MNQKGFTLTDIFVIFGLMLGSGLYFAGAFQPLVSLGIGDPLFFVIIGGGFLIIAVMGIIKGGSSA